MPITSPVNLFNSFKSHMLFSPISVLYHPLLLYIGLSSSFYILIHMYEYIPYRLELTNKEDHSVYVTLINLPSSSFFCIVYKFSFHFSWIEFHCVFVPHFFIKTYCLENNNGSHLPMVYHIDSSFTLLYE